VPPWEIGAGPEAVIESRVVISILLVRMGLTFIFDARFLRLRSFPRGLYAFGLGILRERESVRFALRAGAFTLGG